MLRGKRKANTLTHAGPAVVGAAGRASASAQADVATSAPAGEAKRMPHDVFISYPSEQKVTADAICATLERNGIRCWLAPRDILPGESFAAAIVRAIENSRLLILIFSRDSNRSPHVRTEVANAFDRGLSILTVRVEDIIPSAEMKYYLSRDHWLDAVTPPIQAHFDRLVYTVRVLLGYPGLEAEVAPAPTPAPQPRKVAWWHVVAAILALAALVWGVVAAVRSCDGPTPTPTSTLTLAPSATATPTQTRSVTPTSTRTRPTATSTQPTSTPTKTATPTATATPTQTAAPTMTATPTASVTHTALPPTATSTPSRTRAPSATPTVAPSQTPPPPTQPPPTNVPPTNTPRPSFTPAT